jgi:hypothetical protein
MRRGRPANDEGAGLVQALAGLLQDVRVAITAQEQRLGEAALRATAGQFGAGGLRRMGLFHLAGARARSGTVRVRGGGRALVATPAGLAVAEVEAAILGAHLLEQAPVLRAVDAEEVAQAGGAAAQELLVRERGGAVQRIQRVERVESGRRGRHGERGRVVIGVGPVVVAGRVLLLHRAQLLRSPKHICPGHANSENPNLTHALAYVHQK